MNAFTTNERKSLTDQQKAKLFLERGGKCHRCKRKLRSGDDWIVEHVIALQNGGTNDFSNLDLTCEWCFKPKNAEDAKQAAKTRRVATKHIVPRKRRQKRGSMPGSKASGWRQKLNGSWERREE